MKNKVDLKRLKFKVNNVVVIAFVLVIAVLFNSVCYLLENKFPRFKFDLSDNGLTRITSITGDLLDELDETDAMVDIIYLKGTSDVSEDVEDVLKRYDAYGHNVTYTVENYHTNPLILEPFGINPELVYEGTVVVTNKDRTRYRAIIPSEMWSDADFLLESKVSNAICYVVSNEITSVAVATGYGNDENYTTLCQVLFDDNYYVSTIDLAKQNIPEDLDVLLILAPYNDLTEAEIANTDSYLSKGGSVVVALPFGTTLNNLEAYLSIWGVKANNDVVYEMNPSYSFEDAGVAFYPNKKGHMIADNIESNLLINHARSIEVKKVGDIDASLLLCTSDMAVTTPPVDSNQVKAEDIKEGVFNLAYILEKPVENDWEKTGKLLVTSTPSIWGVEGVKGVIEETRFGNRAFVNESLSYLSGKEIQSVAIPRKTATNNVMNISDKAAGTLSVIFCTLIPVLVLLMGIVVWIKRRNK